jgi:glutaredoxin-like protein NrdH
LWGLDNARLAGAEDWYNTYEGCGDDDPDSENYQAHPEYSELERRHYEKDDLSPAELDRFNELRRNRGLTASRTAMPAPNPDGMTYHYHSSNDTIPLQPVTWSHEPQQRFSAPAVEARHNGKHVGYLEWHPRLREMTENDISFPSEPPTIGMINVHPEYRSQSIATSMLDLARQHEPDLQHSHSLTEEGEGWMNYEQSRNQKEAHIMTAAVTVYTKPDCPQCSMTKKQLDKLGIDHDTVDVTTDPEAHAYVTGLGYASAPVVVVNDGEAHWSGFRPDHLRGLVE